MSCVLRAVGTSFDVDAFLRKSQFEPDSVFHRGEPRLEGPSDGPKRGASGFNLTLSEASFDDLPGQIADVTHFLIEHEDELRRLAGFDGVDEVCLDFGVRRLDVAAQSEIFPADLLWRAGALDIDLVVTHHEIAGGKPSGGTPAGN